jgi:hypothetical protein
MPLFRDLVRLITVVSISAFAVACTPKPPPEEPEPEPAPKEEPKPEPPPKPECKSLDEKCKADESTQAKVAHSDLVFIPPAGWIYAQEPEVTIAQTEEGGGGLVVTTIPGSDPKSKEFKEKRDAAVESLAQALGVTLPNKPGTKKRAAPNWDKPDGDTKAGEVKLEIWQFDGATRGSKDGPVVLILGRNGETSLLAIGFAPKGDSSDQSIMKSLETIGPGSPQ